MSALTGIERRVADLEATVRRLEALLGQSNRSTSTQPPVPERPDARGGLSRRRMLAGGAAAGVVGAAVSGLANHGGRVAAANGDPLKVGEVTTATSETRLTTSSDYGLYVSDGGFAGATTAKVAGYPGNAGPGNGVMGIATNHTIGLSGFGVVADGFREGSGLAPTGRARAQLFIRPDGDRPTGSALEHFAGEIVVDEDTNSLWYCAVAGTPGSWKQLAGSVVKTPGELQQQLDGLADLTLIAPQRVYDSRFGDGQLLPGQSRSVSVRNGIDIETGEVVTPNLIPAATTGIMFNLAAIDTLVGGFLSVTPGNATDFSAASINWSADGQVLNNGTTSTVFQRAVRVWCGGLGGADFTIDLTGYVV